MSRHSYPAYRDSGVDWLGDVPEHWEAKRAKYLVSINDDSLGEKEDPLRQMAYVDIGSVDATAGVTDIEEMVFEDSPSRARRLVKDGDTIISTVRTYLRAIAFIEDARSEMVVSTGFAVVRPRALDPRFAAWAMRERGFIEEIVARSTGVSYPAINAAEIGELPIPLPPVAEQRTIAAFLDRETSRIDALIEKKRLLLERLEEQRTALISRTVTHGLPPEAARAAGLDPSPRLKPSGVEWLGDVPEHWEVTSLGWHIDVRSGDFLPNDDIEPSRDAATPHPVVGGNGVMGFTSQTNTPADTVVIGRVGALCGNVHLVNERAWVTDNALRIRRARSFNPQYLQLQLGAMRLNQWANVNAQPLITGSMLKSRKVVLPPLAEQDEIARWSVEALRDRQRVADAVVDAIERLQEYRTALITAAVTGKIDVRKTASKPAPAR